MTAPEILSALTTPFTDGEVDSAAMRANLDRLVTLVDGVFVGGTTGEYPALTTAEHGSLVAQALEVFGPQRVVVHVGAPSTRQALELTRQARDLGATRYAAITPYYIPATPRGILRHWAAINEECGGELYGYVYPDVAVTDLKPADLPEVLKSGIAGIKVSDSASRRVVEYLDNAPEGFKLWSGNDADVPAVMRAGGTGTVSGVSGATPRPWAALRDAMRDGDEAAAVAAQAVIAQVVPVLGSSIANLKHALHLQGLDNGEPCRMSIDQPDGQTMTRIAAAVDLANQ
ncbi:dihydrodipicolinate synthase family protein [Tessaracoccus rhinocerotis]|uniref:Dihydrodipicolinate synthase family protein n=1 Tax=Tessaracoccus rhinocerotis TaxID=1689449 RepID=A0A553K081_9ACTN|nr:dihydrodipicolinate synthase family protein [Tessaracoccus rhinocerotis]TRY18109.1 dihydrodipicolinate synthase family protein [Tessaracoccus rhinocerotis]